MKSAAMILGVAAVLTAGATAFAQQTYGQPTYDQYSPQPYGSQPYGSQPYGQPTYDPYGPYGRAPSYDPYGPTQPTDRFPPEAYDVYTPQNPYYPEDQFGRGRGQGYGQVEALYAVEAGRDRVRIRVSSNGCTRRADFQARVSAGRTPQVTFTRVRPDNCRALVAGGTWLEFSYPEVGLRQGDEFSLGNPLTPWIGVGR